MANTRKAINDSKNSLKTWVDGTEGWYHSSPGKINPAGKTTRTNKRRIPEGRHSAKLGEKTDQRVNTIGEEKKGNRPACSSVHFSTRQKSWNRKT